jgi:hypothetical protein
MGQNLATLLSGMSGTDVCASTVPCQVSAGAYYKQAETPVSIVAPQLTFKAITCLATGCGRDSSSFPTS